MPRRAENLWPIRGAFANVRGMDPLLYADGEFRNAFPISSDDHGALYGAGFFETFRTRDGEPVRLSAHLARLRGACRRIGIRIPDTFLASGDAPARLRPVVRRLLEAQGLSDGVFRLTVTAGPGASPADGGDYAAPREILSCRPLPPEAPPGGVALRLLETVRDTGEWRPRPKSLNYLNSLLASRELAPLRRTPSDEGLLLDACGRVSECVFRNIFWVTGGVVVTPHEDTGALPGVGRAHLLAGLHRLGVPTMEAGVGPAELVRADTVAVVSCVRGVTPVNEIFGFDGAVLRRASPADAEGLALLREAWGD